MTDELIAPSGVPPAPIPRKGGAWWWYLLIGLGVAMAGSVAVLMLLASWGPDTKVYAGHEVPKRFVRIIRELGMLEETEKLRYFYSSALVDIRDGFCFVSDRKVGIYNPEVESPAIQVPFERIENADLESSDTWLVDGEITLDLKEGEVVEFEVSSELNRDKKFLAAIREGMARGLKKEG